MRILFASLSGHGHTYPLLPLAIAARAQGHDIHYATDPEFHAPLERLGFTATNAGISIGEAFVRGAAMAGVDMTSPTPDEFRAAAAEAFGTLLPSTYAHDLGPVLDRLKPDLVVFEIGCPGAGIAAMKAGVPVVCHGFGRVNRDGISLTANDNLSRVAADFGVDVPPGHNFVLGQPYLDIFPASLQDMDYLSTVPRFPLRPVPFAEPGELPAWVVEHAKPLVYLTLGTAFTRPELLLTAIDGLSRLDTEVLVATGPVVPAEQLSDVPSNVHVMQWVPQADLLPYTDLVVHHGGSGTTVSALTTGLPQLMLPQGADQFRNAEIIAENGLGAQLVGEAMTPDAVHEAARSLLDDMSVRDAADAVAKEIAAMPHPDEVVGRLVEFVR